MKKSKKKKYQTHQERHVFLHKHLDELLADYINETEKLISETKFWEFIEWSHLQTMSPSEKGLDKKYKETLKLDAG